MLLFRNFRYALIALLIALGNYAIAQSYEVGEWVDHISKRDVILLDENDGVIYAATGSAVFLYDISSGELTTKSTVEGLSDVKISAIKYNSDFNFLMVGYASGLIDFVYDDYVYTIIDIQQNNSLNSKIINNIHYSGDTAYLACDFGLVLLNIPEKEIQSTYFLGTSEEAVMVKDAVDGFDSLWVATDKGIYVAPLAETNLHNYQNWSLVEALPLNNDGYKFVEKIGDSIYCASTVSGGGEDIVYIYKNGSFSRFAPNNSYRVMRLDRRGDYYTLISSYKTRFYEENGKQKDVIFYNGYQNNWRIPGDAVFYRNERYFAESSAGLVRYNNGDQISIYPNSPFANAVNQIVSHHGKTYVTGGIPGAKYDGFGMYIYDDYWLNLNRRNNNALKQIPNINYVAFEDGNDSRMYATSYGYGFLVFEDTALIDFYNQNNSTLQNISGYPDVYIITTGLQADDEVGAWVTLSGVPNPINYYNGVEEWSAFDLNGEITNSVVRGLKKMPWNHMWCAAEGEGIIVFDPEKLKEGQISDGYNTFKVKSSDGSTLTSSVTVMEVDMDGYVWFGMDEGGLAVFYNAASALENDITASKIIVEQGGIAQYLLENERVSSIAIDAGNRKWIGTETGGAFLLSSDGTEQILNLNAGNSPLPTDFIRDIEVDEENGMVYIGTDEGVLGYFMGVKESVFGNKDLKIFPNPVYETYNDLVRIEGLQNEMKLKIADVAGKIVFETTATGGTAYWNMKDFNNKRVSTGVYMFYASSQDGSQTSSGKVFVVSQ